MVHRGLGAAIPEGQVVLVGAALVTVPFDQQQLVGVLLQPRGAGIEGLGVARTDHGLVEVEEDRLHRVVRLELLGRGRRRRGRGRGRGRCRRGRRSRSRSRRRDGRRRRRRPRGGAGAWAGGGGGGGAGAGAGAGGATGAGAGAGGGGGGGVTAAGAWVGAGAATTGMFGRRAQAPMSNDSE